MFYSNWQWHDPQAKTHSQSHTEKLSQILYTSLIYSITVCMEHYLLFCWETLKLLEHVFTTVCRVQELLCLENSFSVCLWSPFSLEESPRGLGWQWEGSGWQGQYWGCVTKSILLSQMLQFRYQSFQVCSKCDFFIFSVFGLNHHL